MGTTPEPLQYRKDVITSMRSSLLVRHNQWHQDYHSNIWNTWNKGLMGEALSRLFEFNTVHYLLVVDYYSWFPVPRALQTLTATVIIKHLKQIFSEYGILKTLRSECSPWFDCQEFRNFGKQWCFTHTLSSLRHPQSNGLAEWFVQTVKAYLTKYIASGQ